MKSVIKSLALFFRAIPLGVVVFIVVAALLGLAAFRFFPRHDATIRTLADLKPGEYVYVERMVLLERAKSVALVDRTAGEALLDSLAAAWGDSSLERTLAGVPVVPERSAAVAEFLRRIMTVEQESLRVDPRRDRLAAPIVDPPLPEPAAEPVEEQET